MLHQSEEEQVEALKKWWQANASAIITGLVLGVAVIVGWQWWTGNRTQHAEQASLHYDALSVALATDNAAEARRHGQTLVDDYDDTPYAVLAALGLARLAADGGDNAAAIRHLEWVEAHAGQPPVQDIARLRLARLLLAEGRLDDAAGKLDKVQGGGFTAELEELKGDIYLARNQPDKARESWRIAQLAAGPEGGSPLLALKLDNLPPAAGQEN
ncbi:MAG: tetratricopeptide repeat protein [Pseudomonadota bacterium]|nr:tetratricopeptide repeat protein [Pseudomonadota bacterium]